MTMLWWMRSDEADQDQLLEEIELLDGASAEFDHGSGVEGRTLPGILRICPDQFWRGDIFETFPSDDHFAASAEVGSRDRSIPSRKIFPRLYSRFRRI